LIGRIEDFRGYAFCILIILSVLAIFVEDKMVLTRSPEEQDIDRPLSGPHIPVAGVCTSRSDVAAVSRLEEQAKSATGASKDVMQSVDE